MNKTQCCWKMKLQYCEVNGLNVASLAERVKVECMNMSCV